MSYEYKAVIEMVTGLNSVSTLKKWRKKAEDLAGVTFQEGITGVRGKYHVRVPIFSDSDVEKFQQVANLKSKLGLDNAILHTFTNKRDPPKSINERISEVELLHNNLIDDLGRKFNQLDQENKSLNSQIYNLRLHVEELRKQLEEQNKPKVWFNRKK